MAKIVTSIPSSTNITNHNSLPGLNEGDYLHLTQLEKDGLTFVPSNYDLEDFTNIGVDPYLKQSDAVPGSANLSYTASPTQGVVISDTGTDATIPLVDFTNAGILTPSEKQLLYNNSSTGATKFEGFSINTDPTKYDLGLVEGWFVDNTTNPNVPTKAFKSFATTTANTLTNIATQNVTYIAIDINGTHIQSGVPFEPQLQRGYIPLGVIVHSNRTTINVVNNQPVIAISPNGQLSDLIESIGFFNITGNVFSPNGANLSINKSAGQVFKQGSNFINDNKDPHTLSLSALIAPNNIRYRTQLGVESANTNVIAPNFWDNAGVLTAMSGTRWSIQRIYIFQSNLIRIQYGQATYATQADAIQAIATEPFIVEQNILENGLFRGLLVVRRNTTNLTDTTRALFIEASKFGSVAGLGSLSTTSLQQAYNNSITPEITTDATLGALTIKRGSAADTDNIFEGQNGAGTTTASIDGNGNILGNNLSGTNTGDQDLSGKQDSLVSGTNIKTINGASILGSGDITVTGGATTMDVATFSGNIDLSKQNGINYGSYTADSNVIITSSNEIDGGFAQIKMIGDGAHEPFFTNFQNYEHTIIFNKTSENENGIAFFRLFGKNFYNIIYGGALSTIVNSIKSLYVTNVNNNVTLNNTNYPFNTTTPFTIRFKVNRVAGSTFSGVFSLANATLCMVEVLLSNDNQGCYLFFGGASYGVGKIYGQSSGPLSLGIWQDICITYDGTFSSTATKVYVNNVEVTTIVALNTYDSSPTGINKAVVGYTYWDNSQTQNMKLANLVIINKVLNTTERNEAYNGGNSYNFSSATFLSNIISWHKFDNNLLDSINTNNGSASIANYTNDSST